MVKILSQSGDSLADIYDVEGSVAGIDQLETRELPIVHEMGATVFSERFSTTTRRSSTGAIAQSTAFGIVIGNLPPMPTRLLCVTVLSDDETRIADAAIVLRDPDEEQELVVWAFDGSATVVRLVDDAQAVATFDLLHSSLPFVQTMVGGGEQQPDMVDQIGLRGITTAFGAGDVTITAIYHLAFAFRHGLSSRGLPIPSW